jgi:serine-type D-Ala-D-Ala carboxypeptidase/endopeptidase (penicillin-binding protein 4)
MLRTFFISLLSFSSLCLFSQERSLKALLSDSAMMHASVSLCVADAENGEVLMDYNSIKSLNPASVMKLVTSAAALELLGPDYTFKTTIGYTGTINKHSGRLKGDIIIKGGGDPALGSKDFTDHYHDFQTNWIDAIKKTGIKKIDGRIITDDSYYDFQPVPTKWLWEDFGNYYGAGAYGLSVFDNTCDIHLIRSSDNNNFVISGIEPAEYKVEFLNLLDTTGTIGGYVFVAPYSISGWISGTIPGDNQDYILKGSIADPPLLLAKMMNDKLEASGINITGDPTTIRLMQNKQTIEVNPISETISPPLSEIIKVQNHESVNLYAEHLIKELGVKYKNKGSTAAGVKVIMEFLGNKGIKTDGMFIEDGSGLSPLNAINTKELVNLMYYMKSKSPSYPVYYSSLPEAGKEGTLKNYFRDPVFDSRFSAKSGSMTRVRSYAGYLTTISGKSVIFSIIINNYSGPSINIISDIEEIIKEIILNK